MPSIYIDFLFFKGEILWEKLKLVSMVLEELED